jgi:hypothetical protein
VIRRRHRRVIAMRQVSSLCLQPRVVERIRRAYERQRPAECVDQLLVMPVFGV